MGETVSGTANVIDAVERVVKAGGYPNENGEWVAVSRAIADRCIGMMVRDAYGMSAKVSNDSAARYAGLKRYLAIVPSPDLFGDFLSFTGRLDFESGREVVGA